MTTSKINKLLYRVFTLLFSIAIGFSGISDIQEYLSPGGQLTQSMTHLGYPVYILLILGSLKLLGVIALLVPGFSIIKEWAYAGFTFELLGATISHILGGDPFTHALFPLIFLLLLTASYVFHKKVNHSFMDFQIKNIL